MKKFIALLLAALCLLFTSCSGKNSGEAAFSRGTVENGVYRNTSMGITVAPGDGWTFCSDEEIARLYGISADSFLNEDASDSFKQANIVYDMYCSSPDGDSMNVNYENAGLYALALGSAKDYLELSSSNLESQLNLEGVTIEKNEIGEIEINGSSVPCLYVTLTYSEQGVTLYEFIVAEKRGSRFAVITAGSPFEERLAELAKAVTIG